MKKIMEVVAKDEKGNEYVKNVSVRLLVSFGWPIEYEFETLKQLYPHRKAFCIDVRGRNHNGIPGVSIEASDMNKIIELINILCVHEIED